MCLADGFSQTINQPFKSRKIGYNVKNTAAYAYVKLEASINNGVSYYLNCLKGRETVCSYYLRTNKEYLVDLGGADILSFYHPTHVFGNPTSFNIVVKPISKKEERKIEKSISRLDALSYMNSHNDNSKFMANPKSTENTKKMFGDLVRLINEDLTLYGYCDEFTRGIFPDGTYWQPTNAPFPKADIKFEYRYSTDNDSLYSDQIREYGIVNSATGVQLTPYLSMFILEKNGKYEYVTRGDADYWGQECSEAIKKYYNKYHGLVILTCSLFNPWNYKAHGIKKDENHPDIWNEILNEKNPYHEVSREYIYRVLERLTRFINSLIDENGERIPVVVRTLGELDSNFWWCYGTTSRENIIHGYRLMVDYIKSRCDNVLYDFSILSSSAGNGITYSLLSDLYPGDDYCDIIGFSHYINGSEENIKSAMRANREIIRFCKSHHKLIAMTETGCRNLAYDHTFIGKNSVLDLMTSSDFKSCYSLCWFQHRQGFHIPFTSKTTVNNQSAKQHEDYKKFLNSDHILDATEFSQMRR